MQSGELVLLKELQLDRHVIGKYMRVTGNVTTIDYGRRLCQIEHTNHILWVDLTYIDLVAHEIRVSTLVQFIGEICNADDREPPIAVANSGRIPFYMLAKVARVVDGLDLALYEQALVARRAFLGREHL